METAKELVRIIFRELCKAFMFALLFIGPVWLARVEHNNHFLWLLIASYFIISQVWQHYEKLEAMDTGTFAEMIKQEKEENNDDPNS